MGTRTIAVAGVTEQDAARFGTLIDRHAGKLDAHWEGAPHAEADVLIVDVESAYGQMDWLKARALGRMVIAYTSASNPLEPEFALRKPVVGPELIELLNRIDANLGASGNSAKPRPIAPANAESYEEEDAAPSPPPSSLPKTTPNRRSMFVDELLGMLDPADRPVRLVTEGLPSIIIDPARERWHAGVGLKALAGWCKHLVNLDQLVHLPEDEFEQAVEILPAQPYPRLIWLARLTRGEGNLDPSLPLDAQFRLTRWPQVEREFPKHFRIATTMMRAAGTVEQIAAQSTASAADVADFINAYHALGYIEYDAPVPAGASSDRSGLLDRMRKSLRTS